ncbi:MAG: signal recognition particle-docking protein FtsY [Pseudobdellovibrionaceae bacterium]
MTAESSNAMLVMITVIGLLVFVMVGVLVASLRKRRLPEVPAEESGPQVAMDVEARKESLDEEEMLRPSTTLRQALAPTEKNLLGRIKEIFTGDLQKKNFEEIEEVLYTSDLGPLTVDRLMGAVKEQLSRGEKNNLEAIKSALRTEFEEIFEKAHIQEPHDENTMAYMHLSSHPSVWMIVGVNGTGKTTSIGKIAAHLAFSGRKVLVAAGDTFRAAAGSQLKTWTERAQVEIFSPPGVTDPSAVAFDAVSHAKAKGYDVVIVDTAGRLHTQANLMEELKKMKRVITKVIPDAPHEVLIVLDANSGQNALVQAREFNQALQLTGVVLTKMDGTAKGGVAVGLAHELKVPIRFIGVGEKIGDLRPFSAKEFVESIL